MDCEVAFDKANNHRLYQFVIFWMSIKCLRHIVECVEVVNGISTSPVSLLNFYFLLSQAAHHCNQYYDSFMAISASPVPEIQLVYVCVWCVWVCGCVDGIGSVHLQWNVSQLTLSMLLS